MAAPTRLHLMSSCVDGAEQFAEQVA
jgi:hypothetical protein